MPFAALEVEVVGRTGHAEQRIDFVERKLERLAAKSFKVRVELDDYIFQQLDVLERNLRLLGRARFGVGVDLDISGEQATLRGLKAVEKGLRDGGQAVRENAEEWRKAEIARQKTIAAERAAAIERERAAQGLSNSRIGRPETIDDARRIQTVKALQAAEQALEDRRQGWARAERQRQEAIGAAHAAEIIAQRKALGLATSRIGPVTGIDEGRRMQAERDAQKIVNEQRVLLREREKVIAAEHAAEIMRDRKKYGLNSSRVGPVTSTADGAADHAYMLKVRQELQAAKKATSDFNRELKQSQALIGQVNREAEKTSRVERQRYAQAEREMRRARGELSLFEKAHQNLARTVGSLINTVNRWLIGYLAVSGLIQLFAGLKFAVIDYNSILERSTIALTTMLDGNAQAAGNLLGQLEKFAQRTPFEFAELVPLTQKLVALGVVAKDKVEMQAVPAIEAMANAVAALGAGTGQGGLESVIRALGQMSQKGKASAEEVTQQLAEVGINGAEYIAKAMNTTVPKVFEQMKKGAIDGKKAVAAILLGLSEDGKFKGMAEKMSATFAGAMSNMKDATQSVVANGFAPLFKEMSRIAQGAATIAKTEVFRKWGAEKITTLIAYLRMVGNTVIWLYEQFMDKLPYITTALTLMAGQRVITGILVLRATLIALGTGTATAATRSSLALGLWGVAIAAFVAAYRNIEQVSVVTTWVGETVLKVFKAISVGVAQAVDFIFKPMALLGEMMDKIPENVLAKFGVGGDVVRGMRDFAKGFDMSGAPEDAGKWWDEQIANFQRGNAAADKFMKQGLSGSGGGFGMKEMVADAKKEAAAALKDTGEAMKKAQADWRKQLAGGLGMDGGTDKDAAKRRRAALKLENDRLEDAAKFNDEMAAQTKSAYDRMARAAEDSAKRQLDALKSVRDRLQELLGGFQESLSKYGVLTSPLDAVISRVEKLVNLGPRAAAIGSGTVAQLKALNSASEAQQRAYQTHALHARMSLDKNQGGDGSEPGREARLNRIGAATGNTPAFMERMFAKVGQATAVQCGQAISDALGSPGFATGVARGTRGRTVQAVNGRFPDGAVVAQDYGRKNQHFFVAYTDAKGIQRKLESTTAGGSRHYRDDRPVTARDLERVTRAALPPGIAGGVSYPGGGGRLPRFLKGAGGRGVTDVAALESTGEDLVASIVSELDNLKLRKLVDIPKEFGAPIKEAEGHTNRYKAQMMLADEATQKLLRSYMGGQFGDFVKLIAEAADKTDELETNLRATAEINEMQKRAATRNHENDPYAALAYRTRKGGDLEAVDPFKLWALQEGIRNEVIGDAVEASKRLSNAENDRRKAILATRPFVKEASVDTYNMARAQELLNKKIEYARSPEMVKLYKTDRAKFNEFNNTQARKDAQGFDLQAGEARRLSMAQAREELEREKTALTAQIPIVRDFIGTNDELNRTLENQGYYLQQLYRLRAEGHSDPRSRELASELTMRQHNNRELEKSVALERELREGRQEVNRARSAMLDKNIIYGTTEFGSEAQARALAMREAMAEIDRKRAEGGFTTTTKTKSLGEFSVFNQGAYEEAIRQARNLVDIHINDEKILSKTSAEHQTQQELQRQRNALSQRALEITGSLSEAGRYLSDLELERAQRANTIAAMTDKEYQTRLAIADVLRAMPALEHAAKMAGFQDQLDALGVADNRQGDARADFLRRRSIDRITDPTLRGQAEDTFKWEQTIRDADRAAKAVEQAWGSIEGAMKDSFDVMFQTSGSVFDRITAGAEAMLQKVTDYLLDISAQIITNWAITQLIGMMPGAGNFMGGLQNAANQGPTIGGIVSNVVSGRSAEAQSMRSTGVVGGESAAGATVNQTFTFPNVRNAEDAKGVSKEIAQTTRGAVDSRRTQAQNGADLVDFGKKNR